MHTQSWSLRMWFYLKRVYVQFVNFPQLLVIFSCFGGCILPIPPGSIRDQHAWDAFPPLPKSPKIFGSLYWFLGLCDLEFYSCLRLSRWSAWCLDHGPFLKLGSDIYLDWTEFFLVCNLELLMLVSPLCAGAPGADTNLTSTPPSDAVACRSLQF